MYYLRTKAAVDAIKFTLEKTAVVLIIAGSGPTDRNGNNPMMTNNSLKMLAKELQKNGIASVRYDKRGIGESFSRRMGGSVAKIIGSARSVEIPRSWFF